MSNLNFMISKKNRNDEFYTLYDDIKNELDHYSLKDYLIYANCDGLNSKFIHYFKDNNLKFINSFTDFRLPENLKLLKECDIVITNPPFSLFLEFLDLLMKFKKKFLIIGYAITINRWKTFKYFKTGQLRLGYSNNVALTFKTPNKMKKKVLISWYTNLPVQPISSFLQFSNKTDFQEYDNYKAIHINKVKEIPDYDGVMGVPTTFLKVWNPKQFKILGLSDKNDKEIDYLRKTKNTDRPILNGKEKFARIFIKKLKKDLTF